MPFELKFRAAYDDRRSMKANRELETQSDESLVIEGDLTAESTGGDLANWTVGEAIDPLTSIQSTDQSPYGTALTAHAETIELPIPFIPRRPDYEKNNRELSGYAENLDIPVVYPVRDLDVQKPFRRIADWAISQREYKLEWVAFIAAVYACGYVFNGLIQALPHLPFKP